MATRKLIDSIWKRLSALLLIDSIWKRLSALLRLNISSETIIEHLVGVYKRNKSLSKEDLKHKMLEYLVDNNLLGTGIGREAAKEMLAEPINKVKPVTEDDIEALDKKASDLYQQAIEELKSHGRDTSASHSRERGMISIENLPSEMREQLEIRDISSRSRRVA
ncbi:MAG: hypothetical protein HC877_17490 [Thioploca sp.]|nr:hypothetical protein [Thioploca sp.]